MQLSQAAVSRVIASAICATAIVIALISARPFAGSWSDGSRLATVESLIDYHTWAIDDSIFVHVPQGDDEHMPYSRAAPALSRGTQDKLWINGHFYSDKSPVPALFLAGIYKILQLTTGLTARDHVAWFCWLMTIFSSGAAYVVAVCAMDRLALAQHLRTPLRLAFVVSFGLATVALTYSRQVNNHILLLAVCSGLILLLTRRGDWTVKRLLASGALLGVGYTIDLGVGPWLVVSAVTLIAFRTRNAGKVVLVLAAAFPWFALHHALNYRIGGSFWPANLNPAHFAWPGSPFDSANLTGGLRARPFVQTATYALDLLFGKRGFLAHNLPLFLALPGAAMLLHKRVAERPEILFAICFSTGTWVLYALTSNNYSGLCISIRWFVPLLAPAYYLVALLLRQDSRCEKDFLLLSAGGLVLGVLMWWRGPWFGRIVPGFWLIYAATLLLWLAYRCRPRKS